jgi:hypothetical protein
VGGALAFDAAWIFVGFLALVVLAAVVIASRRFLLERGGGTVECGLRRQDGGPWRLGVASYQQDEFRWYDAVGVLLRPEEVFPRRSLTVVSRRDPDPVEEATLGAGRIVVEATSEGSTVEFAMTPEALTGFLAWLESAPPGSHLDDFA